MNLSDYLAKKKSHIHSETLNTKHARETCRACRKSKSTCFCEQIKPFAAGAEFVILIHPKENRKRVGTGRLTHLCIKNSQLIEGIDFTHNAKVNELLSDPGRWPVVLYPGAKAVDISQNATTTLESVVPHGKKLVIIVMDGTWFCAKKMLRISRNLSALPQIRFTPPRHSIYEIRKQPKAICFSSVEAVHFIVEQLAGSARWGGEPGHHNLIHVFRYMIKQQLSHVSEPGQRAVRGIRK